MSGRDGSADVAIIGAGRMGKGLALALTRRGREVAGFGRNWDSAVVGRAPLVLLAVPDDAIAAVASELAASGTIREHHVVLHLSGLLDRNALAPLGPSGAARGSFHPLQSISDPTTAPERLQGAYAGIEGDERALVAAEGLAVTLGMTAVRIAAAAKPAYHAAASLTSNYTVALLGVAERIAEVAGISHEVAARLYLPLLQGTVANLAAVGPAAALTGPVRRGDIQTIRNHLAVLSPNDRELYRHLARAALDLAREAGLEREKASQVEDLLADNT